MLTPHTDKLTLNADLLDTEGPLLQLTSQIPPAAASQSPNLKPPSLSLSPSLGVGVHIMAANRQSLDSANIGVISGHPLPPPLTTMQWKVRAGY